MKVSEEYRGEHDKSTISVDSVAVSIGVSLATIRNWIKLGYLKKTADGRVDRDSFESLRNDVIGKDKLTNRANKTYKQCETKHPKYDINKWQDYENTLSDAHRNREGIYYTPSDIARDMMSRIGCGELRDKIFLDPCCGSGNFLIEALELGALPQNLYGFDTDPVAVKITKRRIEEMTGYRSKNIRCNDFLEAAHSLKLRADYIVTNPPWGKKIDRKRRESLAALYGCESSLDSSSLFLMASLHLLKEGGAMAFLLQEALFNIGIFSEVRSYLFRLQIDAFIDYGRAFKPLLTKAQAIILTKQVSSQQDILCIGKGGEFYRSSQSFNVNPNLIFNFTTPPDESDVIEMVYKKRHSTLRGCAKWGLGVVTGNNKKFCSDTQKEGYVAVYRGADLTPQGFKAASIYIDGNLAQYQQSAPIEMYNAPKKIIYKFISSKLCFCCDTEQRLILNSANFFILNDGYPIKDQEFVKLLNSDFMNWLFKRIFSTHKIVRDNLESLPIFIEYFENGRFNEEYYLAMLGVETTQHGGYRLKGCIP